MTILEHAERALRDAGGGPLRSRDIAERMLRNGWITKAKTPFSDPGGDIAADLRKKGPRSRFIRFARGLYGLNPTVRQ